MKLQTHVQIKQPLQIMLQLLLNLRQRQIFVCERTLWTLRALVATDNTTPASTTKTPTSFYVISLIAAQYWTIQQRSEGKWWGKHANFHNWYLGTLIRLNLWQFIFCFLSAWLYRFLKEIETSNLIDNANAIFIPW